MTTKTDKQKKEKVLFHKECIYCGGKFDTYKTNKIFCSPRCQGKEASERANWNKKIKNPTWYKNKLIYQREYQRKRREEIKNEGYLRCARCFHINDRIIFGQKTCTNCAEYMGNNY